MYLAWELSFVSFEVNVVLISCLKNKHRVRIRVYVSSRDSPNLYEQFISIIEFIVRTNSGEETFSISFLAIDGLFHSTREIHSTKEDVSVPLNVWPYCFFPSSFPFIGFVWRPL